MTRGILYFGHNNELAPYATLALVSALTARRNMPDWSTALVSDQESLDALRIEHSAELIDFAFDEIILTEAGDGQARKAFGADGFTEVDNYNHNRSTAYALTPFDETLLVDADFLFFSKILNDTYHCRHDLLMSQDVLHLTHARPAPLRRITPNGIPHYWATVLFFRKGEAATRFFDLVEHVKENYAFYAARYGFRRSFFRNDFVFSVAAHILNGYQDSKRVVGEFASEYFLAGELDDIVEMPLYDHLVFLVRDRDAAGGESLVRIKNINVHVLNKAAILRKVPHLVNNYKPENTNV